MNAEEIKKAIEPLMEYQRQVLQEMEMRFKDYSQCLDELRLGLENSKFIRPLILIKILKIEPVKELILDIRYIIIKNIHRARNSLYKSPVLAIFLLCTKFLKKRRLKEIRRI